MLFQVTIAVWHNYFRPNVFSAENVVFCVVDVIWQHLKMLMYLI